MEITKDLAEKIINSRVLVEEANVPYKGIEVTHIGYTDKDGDAFVDDNDEEYALVSFKAHTPYQLERAVEDFIDEDYESSTNHSLVMRMKPEVAREIGKGNVGTLILREAEVEDEDGEMVTALFAKAFTPTVAVHGKKTSLADRLAKANGSEPKIDEEAHAKSEKKGKDVKKAKKAKNN